MRQGVENNNERQHNIPTGHQSRVTPGDIGLTHFSPPLRFRNQLPTFAVRETDVSRHNGGTSAAPLKPLRDDSALRILSSLRVKKQFFDGNVLFPLQGIDGPGLLGLHSDYSRVVELTNRKVG